MTLPLVPERVHPSGYLIENPAERAANVRNTWLSGMSPVAAERASADSALGPPEPEPVAMPVALAPLPALTPLAVDPCEEPPQPASTLVAASTARSGAREGDMARWCRRDLTFS